jgi:hypothetical protein
MSTNTGLAPRKSAALAVETKVTSGTRTSSPGPTPSAASATSRALEPLFTATASIPSIQRAKRRSNSSTTGPEISQPERTTSAAARASSSSNQGRDSGTCLETRCAC